MIDKQYNSNFSSHHKFDSNTQHIIQNYCLANSSTLQRIQWDFLVYEMEFEL